jgi:methionyl-tRNA formyltransferase
MNIIFFGSDAFAVPTLELLIGSRHRIVSVITQPDRKKGRGLITTPTAVKAIAVENRLSVFCPSSVNAAQAIAHIRGLKPELFVVIAYGQLLSQELLDIPSIMSINLHASLLPRYRGAAPINWALIQGQTACGVTVMKVVLAMDAGPIIRQAQLHVEPDDNAVSLEEKLSGMGAHLVMGCLDTIEQGTYELVPQDETLTSYAPKLTRQDGVIRWQSSALEIINLVRGALPWPGAHTFYRGKVVKIYAARVAASGQPSYTYTPGEILSLGPEGIAVGAGRDMCVITELQIESKRRMTAHEFITGHRLSAGEFFTDKK